MPAPGPAAVLAGAGLAWLGGVALQLPQEALWSAVAYAATGAAALAAAAIAWRAPRAALPLAIVAAAAAGFGLTGLHAAVRLAERLDPALEARDVLVTGVVTTLPQRSAAGVRFRFAVEAAEHDHKPIDVPRLLAIGWYAAAHEDGIGLQPPHALRAGDRWRFTLRLRQPHGHANRHGYDHELALFEQGVRATGSVRPGPAALLARDAGAPVERLRQRVRDSIEARLPDRPRAAGVLAALAVGDQRAIDRDDWDVFRATGVAHLMSISGLHVTMFAWLAAAVIGFAWRRSPRAMLALPVPTAARAGGLVCAAAYALVAGLGVPAQRTLLMLATVVLLPALGVRWPWWAVLLGAACVVTLFDPWALLQPGFWLSFGAVALLFVGAPPVPAAQAAVARWRRAADALRGALHTQAVATLGLAPLTLVFFQQVSIVGFAANLVAIPVVTLAVTPLALLGVLLPPLWSVAAAVVDTLGAALAALAAWPGALWTSAAVAWPWQLAALAGGALAVAPLPWRLRLLAVPLVLPLVFAVVPRPESGRFELIAVDVGQGTAVLVRTATKLVVVDAGPQWGRDSDAGARVLLPLLRARGERRIDLLVLSHRDIDHVGGAAALIGGLPVARLASSLEPGHPLLAGTAHTPCAAGQRWQWDGVEFAFLHPPPGELPPELKPNARSCVLRIVSATGSALLPGDVERLQELALVDRVGAGLQSDVLLVAHHGSRTSSSAPFLDAVRPRVAVVQAGYLNRFGHPAAEVLQRLRERGAAVVATPACGAWSWNGHAESQGICQRDAHRRYWQHPAAAR